MYAAQCRPFSAALSQPNGTERCASDRANARVVSAVPALRVPANTNFHVKCLTVVDEYTRECLAIDVAGSIRSNRVIEVLSQLISTRGAPQTLRSDNGPEFVSRALLRWALKNELGMALIDPGKPWQNGTAESFNGKFRDECLSMEWFRVRQEAKVVIESWREHYNHVRPHSSLENMTPIEFKQKCNSTMKAGAIVQF